MTTKTHECPYCLTVKAASKGCLANAKQVSDLTGIDVELCYETAIDYIFPVLEELAVQCPELRASFNEDPSIMN